MLLLALGCSGDPSPPPPAAGASGPPNVLVVLLDDVGTDKIPSYGEHPTPADTPTIDALAAQGMLFRNAWASPTCSPARGALITGRYGRRYGLGQVDTADEGVYELPPAELTIPEALRAAPDAWSTALVGKWHLAAYKSPDNLVHPGVQGFGWYHATVSNVNETLDPTLGTYFDWELDDNGTIEPQRGVYVTSAQIDDAIAQVRAMPEPWFLYLSLNAPHTPLSDPPDALIAGDDLPDAPEKAVRYHETLDAADVELGRLVAELDLDRTVVIVTADNGTPEHAILPPWNPDHGKQTLFEGGINVPLVVAGPVVAEPGSESAALVALVDLLPTVADLAGLDPSALVREDGSLDELDGQSLVPLLADPTAAGRSTLYAEEFGPNGSRDLLHDTRAVRDERYKLVVAAGSEALFDLEGRVDDGPDLLASPPLAPAAQDHYTTLHAALDGFEDRIQLEY